MATSSYGVLQQLWREAWEIEQNKKQMRADQFVLDGLADLEKRRHDIIRLPTALQKVCEKQGAFRDGRVAGATRASPHMAIPNVLGSQGVLTSPGAIGSASSPYSPNSTGPASTSMARYQALLAQSLSQTMTTTNTLPSHSHTIYPHQSYSAGGVLSQSHPVRSIGNSARDTLFMALRGIEDAALARPKGNHPYDDAAVRLLDMRNFDGKTVKLVELCSFCIANCYPPGPLIGLLEGFGLKVITPFDP